MFIRNGEQIIELQEEFELSSQDSQRGDKRIWRQSV